MFWNIDVKEQEQDLMAVSHFLLSVFEFAADQPGNVFLKEDWLAFAPENGAWFYRLYERDTENGKNMHRAVDRLFRMEQEQRERIWEAIKHDMEFMDKEAWENGRFSLESDQLSDAAQKILKDFFGYFYDVVFCTAHFHLKELSSPMYSRRELAKDYFKGKNKKIRRICPVCLNIISNGETDEEVEHYFPKSRYPCLCLHPYNLYFCCSACRSRLKGRKSPLKGKQRNIASIFLPYLDTVKDQVQLEFENPGNKDSEVVSLLPVLEADPDTGEKIKEFDRLFSLEERWSGQLEEYYMSLYSRYQEKIKARAGKMSLEQLEEWLKKDIKRNDAMQSVRPGRYLEGEYMKWVMEKQLKAFYAELKSGCQCVAGDAGRDRN